ncbi:hypothetical protein P261_01309 [Lachnospiraceae bacterium TWA4]|nr:hypothetical protein P261_01309 [Lachnospiraceae bacterium TWA4]
MNLQKKTKLYKSIKVPIIIPLTILFILLFSIIIILSSCKQDTNSKSKAIQKTNFALDTIIQITIYDSTDESLIDKSFTLCTEYENKLSRTKEGSEIYNLNKNGEGDVSRETLELIQKGLYYSELSDGNFDITIYPVSSLWNFNENKLPNPDSIAEAIKKVNYKKVEINGNHITFNEAGMGIDLGAIAKGYIADKIKEYLVGEGVTSAIINLGGNVLCIGKNVNGNNFGIAVQKPEKDSSEVVEVLSIDGKSVVSSGNYERTITVDGKNYHHILNPKTGYGYENGVLEVSIISSSSVDGDGLSTTCFSLGVEDGLKLLNSIDNAYGMFIDADGTKYYSDGFKEFIKNNN